MKPLFKLSQVFLFFILLMLSRGVSTPLSPKTLWSDLKPAQQEMLNQGKQVVITENVPGAIWPCFHVYRIIKASPCEVTAVFWDIYYDIHYIPSCMKVVVNNRPAPNIVEATYDLRMPLFPKEVSKVRNEVVALPDDCYRNSWTIMSSTYSQSGEGEFLVIPHENGSLICYSNFVVPKSNIACVLRSQAESQLKATVKAIATQVHHEVKEAPEQLATQKKELEAALGKK